MSHLMKNKFLVIRKMSNSEIVVQALIHTSRKTPIDIVLIIIDVDKKQSTISAYPTIFDLD